MTKAAQANKEIQSREKIEKGKLYHDAKQQTLNRQNELVKTQMNAEANIKSAKIKALGSIGAGAMKGFGGGKKNDPAWYKSYINDLDVFTKIPTYDRLGSQAFEGMYRSDSSAPVRYSVPGIMTFVWVPTVGPQEGSNTAYFRNPVNQSLARAKEKVLALNSRSNVSWEASDLGFNFFCSSDIATMITELGRAIRIYQTYHAKNAYFCRAILHALGWSFSDMSANFAEYRKQYVILARKFNSAIIAPKSVTLYQRRLFLASNIFADSEDVKNPRQVYAYVQGQALILAEDETFCNHLAIGGYKNTLSQFVSFVQLCMSRITDSPSFIEMYQDLRAAFKDDLVQLPETIEGETIELNTNPLNREQIHNTFIAPIVYDAPSGMLNSSGFDICQDASGYLYQGTISGTAADRKLTISKVVSDYAVDRLNFFMGNSAKIMANMHKSDVTGDDILDITRNIFTGTVSKTSNSVEIRIDSCGTEVIYTAYIWSLKEGSADPDYNYFSSLMFSLEDGSLLYQLIAGALRSAFDWAPITHVVQLYDDLDINCATFMDAYTTFFIDGVALRDIHSACVMGELYVADLNFSR